MQSIQPTNGIENKRNEEIKSDSVVNLAKASESLKLNSNWIFWYASRKEKDHHIPYDERLSNIAEFNTLEEFFKYYLYLKSVQDIERNTDLGLFKKGYRPLWESCPDGGCWFLRFKKTDDPMDIDVQWEKLLLALVGEQFDEPNMLGAVLSIRGRETIIELWFNYFKYDKIKNGVAQKLRSLLQLDQSFTVYFKDNEKSLQDKSTLRNAETYSFVQQRKSTLN
jgi:translation initiation factor 4E